MEKRVKWLGLVFTPTQWDFLLPDTVTANYFIIISLTVNCSFQLTNIWVSKHLKDWVIL